jgi:hypothetical protein
LRRAPHLRWVVVDDLLTDGIAKRHLRCGHAAALVQLRIVAGIVEERGLLGIHDGGS